MAKKSKKKAPPPPLRGRRLHVVLNVIKGMDNAEAATAAGYRGKRAETGVTTAEIMRDPRARAMEAAAAAKVSKDTGITKERIVAELERLAFGFSFDLKVKFQALKLLGRHIGVKGFFERMELTGKDGGEILTRIESVIVDPKGAS